MKTYFVNFPKVLTYGMLVGIVGVLWSDPLEVLYKGELGKVFQPWFISLIPLIMCLSTVVSSYLKDLTITIANKGLIIVDLCMFANTIYVLASKDYRSFIIVNTICVVFFTIFGKAYSMKMKDIVAKVFPAYNLEYQARATRLDGIIRFGVLLIALGINLLFVVEDPITKKVDYSPIIYYVMVLGVVSIGYEIWYMKPLKYMSLRYNRIMRDLEKKS